MRIARARQVLKSHDAHSVRIAAGLSLADVAEAIGVSAASVHAWENGKTCATG